MGRLDDRFTQLRSRKEKALIAFITAGDPELATTEKLVLAMEKAGADVIELGVPFSDPMADGPTIQKSSERALASGTNLSSILATVKLIRKTSQVPIILMGYYNPVFMYGPEKFAVDAADAGVDGVLIVDLPPEEGGELRKMAAAAGIDLIFLLTPTSDDDRIAKVARLGSGFIYYVSVTGVTGARATIADSACPDLERIKKRIAIPVVAGFGVSDPAQAGRLASISDGVVVGSAIVKLFEEYKGEELVARVADFVAALKKGLRI